MSLRDAEARLLEEHNLERGYEAVRLWVQRTNRATRRYFARPLRHVHRIVVDESEIRVGGEWVWLWAALEPGKRVVLEVQVSALRNGFVARSFMVRLIGKYGRRVVCS